MYVLVCPFRCISVSFANPAKKLKISSNYRFLYVEEATEIGLLKTTY